MLDQQKEGFCFYEKTSEKQTNRIETTLNLSVESSKILSLTGYVTEEKTVCEKGRTVSFGTVVFNIIIGGESFERIERGVKFELSTISDNVDRAFCTYELNSFGFSDENGGVVIYCTMVREITYFKKREITYVAKCDSLNKTEQFNQPVYVFSTQSATSEEVFDFARIEKMLATNAQSVISKVVAGKNMITVEGNNIINFVFLPFKENSDIVKEIKITPFRFEFNLNGVTEDFISSANVNISNCQVKVFYDEENDKSRVECTLLLKFDFLSVGFEAKICLVDCVLPTCQVDLEKCTYTAHTLLPKDCVEERFGGRAECDIPEYSRLIKTLGEWAEVENYYCENDKLIITGKIKSNCLFEGDNGLVSKTASLEFNLAVLCQSQEVSNLVVTVESLQTKLRAGSIEQECLVQISFIECTTITQCLVTDIVKGEEIEQKNYPISIYIGRAGDQEWDVVKALMCDSQTIYKYNSELTFPLKGEERIIVLKGKAD